MSTNKERLGGVLADRMKRTASAANGISVELGSIDGSLSLITDSLKTPIPKGSYMVDLRMKAETYYTEITTHTHSDGHSHGGGSHDHRIPVEFRLLKAGDRVLVAWCGNEPVVVAIVVSS